MSDSRMMWLDNFNGVAKGGYFYRSKFGKEVIEFETKFKFKYIKI